MTPTVNRLPVLPPGPRRHAGRHPLRLAVPLLVLTGLIGFGFAVLRLAGPVEASGEQQPADVPGAAYYVVMPHPASDDQRQLAQWLARRLERPIVQDTAAHEVGIRGDSK